MRQILLTIKNPGRQLEAKDFLANCHHSPQWIGKAEDWEIKCFYLHEEEKPDIHGNIKRHRLITALLESDSKGNVTATSLTAKEIYDVLNSYRKLRLSVGCRLGINGIVESLNYGEITSFLNDKRSYVLCFDKQNNRPQASVEDLLDVLDGRVFDAIRNENKLNDIDNDVEFMSKAMELQLIKDNPEWIEFVTKAPVLVQAAGGAEGHPVTEVVFDNDKVVLIYNQDIVCE